jgi:hypothetical protein
MGLNKELLKACHKKKDVIILPAVFDPECNISWNVLGKIGGVLP